MYVVVFSGGPAFLLSARLLLEPSRSATKQKERDERDVNNNQRPRHNPQTFQVTTVHHHKVLETPADEEVGVVVLLQTVVIVVDELHRRKTIADGAIHASRCAGRAQNPTTFVSNV